MMIIMMTKMILMMIEYERLTPIISSGTRFVNYP